MSVMPFSLAQGAQTSHNPPFMSAELALPLEIVIFAVNIFSKMVKLTQ